ncbi:MAG: sialyltransferase [Methanobrevibacter sp.]|jgi:transcription antitermination factor NusG|nr:sialyltransferase [Methanobrevibacter sp.]
MVKTIKEVCDIILSLEKKYDLNHMKIQGTYPWQLVRMYVYYEIARKIGVFGSPQQGKITLKDKIISFLPFIKNSLINNPFHGNYQKDVLIFDHPRKTNYKGEFRDIYSYFLIKSLDEFDLDFEVIESPYLNKHYSDRENYIKYNDRILLGSYFYKKLSNLTFRTCEEDKIANIEKELNSTFNIKLDLFNIIKTHICDFKYQYKKYNKLFKKRMPKYIFVVVAYENQAMIAAAKNNNIEIIELQHGTISKYHLGYNYPDEEKNSINYFPDTILTFGNYWNEVAEYPISKEKKIAIGFPYLEDEISSYLDHLNDEYLNYKFDISKKNDKKNSKKNKNQILFISQGVIGKYLSKFAYELSEKLNQLDEEYEIVYKLHPGEYSDWKNNYKYLKKAAEDDNFIVIDDNKIPLYELFAKSEYQVGVFSTAIYEGLIFNCKTLVVDLPGIEYLDDLIEKNYVLKIKDSSEFIEKIENFKINKYNRDFFFKKYDKSNLNIIFNRNKEKG